MPLQILGQLRPANTTAASLYSPGANVSAQVDFVVICNTSGSTAKFRLFLDTDGTTYDETTALVWDQSIVTELFSVFNHPLGLVSASSNLAVRTDSANALTFTAFGRE